MRLEKYIINEGRSRQITFDQSIQMAKKCMDAINLYKNRDIGILRGIQTTNIHDIKPYKGDFLSVQPSKFTRKSAYAEGNHYTLLLDNLPSWNKFPKRSKSIVGSTDINKARSYDESDNVYVVFPVNGSRIGVCPTSDIFSSFDGFRSAGDFNLMMLNNISDKTWKSFIDSIDTYERIFDQETINYSFGGIHKFDKLYDKYNNLFDTIAKVFDPQDNGFDVVKSGTTIPRGREVWTDGDCLLIQYDKVDEWLEQL